MLSKNYELVHALSSKIQVIFNYLLKQRVLASTDHEARSLKDLIHLSRIIVFSNAFAKYSKLKIDFENIFGPYTTQQKVIVQYIYKKS